MRPIYFVILIIVATVLASIIVIIDKNFPLLTTIGAVLFILVGRLSTNYVKIIVEPTKKDYNSDKSENSCEETHILDNQGRIENEKED